MRVSPRGGNSTEERFLCTAPADLYLDLRQLKRVVEYEPANLTVCVESGLTLAALQDILREHGQFLPVDPPQPERATVGGMIAAIGSRLVEAIGKKMMDDFFNKFAQEAANQNKVT